jgi:hypothetical protein
VRHFDAGAFTLLRIRDRVLVTARRAASAAFARRVSRAESGVNVHGRTQRAEILGTIRITGGGEALWGAQKSGSRGEAVFVDEVAEAVAALDPG